MTTIKFDDYLEEEFKAGYLIEKNILESAIALSNEKKGCLLTSYIDNS
jgi:hypothetical protein